MQSLRHLHEPAVLSLLLEHYHPSSQSLYWRLASSCIDRNPWLLSTTAETSSFLGDEGRMRAIQKEACLISRKSKVYDQWQAAIARSRCTPEDDCLGKSAASQLASPSPSHLIIWSIINHQIIIRHHRRAIPHTDPILWTTVVNVYREVLP